MKQFILANRKIIIIAVSILAVLALIFAGSGKEKGKNPIEIELLEGPRVTLSDITISEAGYEGTVIVSVSDLKDGVYPAASFVIEFDKEKLSLLSLDEGNVCVESENGPTLPQWGINIDKSNESGRINIMYLDSTAGMRAFTKESVGNSEVLFKLKFKARGNANNGDIYDLVFSDAVFAANDEKESLSSVNKTLKVINGSIKIGGLL